MGDVVERMGQREGDQEIGDRQQFSHLFVAPFIRPIIAALGAMAVAAGVIGVESVLTGVAVIDMAAQDLRATAFDGLHRLFMTGEHFFPILLAIGRAVFSEDIREFKHSW